jgi:hypothetical protein
MLVSVDISEEEIEGDFGTVSGLQLSCTRCGHTVEVGGTGSASAKRGACMLREECPFAENNFYDVSLWA